MKYQNVLDKKTKTLKRGAMIRHEDKNYIVKSYIRDGSTIHVECEEEFQNENWKSVWLKLECAPAS